MRASFTLPLAVGMAACTVAALVVGLPATTAASASAGASPAIARFGLPHGITRAQAEAFVRSAVPGLSNSGRPRLRRTELPRRAKHADVAGWVSDNGGYLWGIDKSDNIVAYHDDCSLPSLARVDRDRNLVVACLGGQESQGIPGTVNVYKFGNVSGPADIVLIDAAGYYPNDAFRDNAGNIYAVNLFQVVCTSSGCNFNPGNVVRWSLGNQKSGAVPDTMYVDPNLGDIFAGDIDAAGRIYVVGFGAESQPEVDVIDRNAAPENEATNLNLPITYPGSVYVVAPNSKTPRLSLVDPTPYGSGGGVLYQFALPIVPGASPILARKTPQNLERNCRPNGAGYDRGGTVVLIASPSCQAIEEGVATGHLTVHENFNFASPQTAVFVPSDK